ncbi:MAG: SCO family protein [Legionella sp.]|nr:SCO family protein [Legionella sp.]
MCFKKHPRLTVFLGLLCCLLIGAFVAHKSSLARHLDPTQFHGTFLEEPRSFKPFSLQSSENQPLTNDNLQGQWTFVFFGFTHCGYICPTSMAELNKMYQLIEKNETRPLPKVLMISVDPERDTLEKLHQYVKGFNPNFYGATGTETNLKQLTEEMGIAYVKVALPNTDPKNYDIQHSGAVILINPEGKLQAFFTPPLQADMLAKDYEKAVAA